MEYRQIFLLVWPSGLFKAHWAIFIPDLADKTFKKGKYIHVEGALDSGFEMAVVRGWDIDQTNRRPGTPIEIGWVQSDKVVDTPTQKGRLEKDAVPRDKIEAFLASVPPPAASLNSVSSATLSTAPSRGKKSELSDCQWWVTRCVNAMVENGMLVPPQKGPNKGKDPLEMIAEAPRH